MSCTQTLCHVDNVGALVPLSVVHAHGSTIDLTIHSTLRIPLYSVVQLPQYQVAPFSAGRPSPRPPRHAVSVIGAHTTGSVRWVAGSQKPVWKKGLVQPTTASEGGHCGRVHDLWGWLLRVRRGVQYRGEVRPADVHRHRPHVGPNRGGSSHRSRRARCPSNPAGAPGTSVEGGIPSESVPPWPTLASGWCNVHRCGEQDGGVMVTAGGWSAMAVAGESPRTVPSHVAWFARPRGHRRLLFRPSRPPRGRVSLKAHEVLELSAKSNRLSCC